MTDEYDYGSDVGAGFGNLTDDDYASILLIDIDYSAQLNAITALLRTNRIAAEKRSAEIQRVRALPLPKDPIAADHYAHEWIDLVHDSVYEDAAFSMAAIGMLAPFTESIFHRAFMEISQTFEVKGDGHPRLTSLHRHKWDCHWDFSQKPFRKNLVSGISELAEAVGLKEHLPKDLTTTLSALFEYRNKMFHHGFEWPTEVRKNFETRIRDGDWPTEWFESSTSDNEPWIFYLSNSFVQHYLQTLELILKALGKYARSLNAHPSAS